MSKPLPASAFKPAPKLDAWFAERAWHAFPFQKEVWKAIAKGESGLLHATTGAGKTYAVWLGALNRFALKEAVSNGKSQTESGRIETSGAESAETSASTQTSAKPTSRRKKPSEPPLTILWITPMRALATDTTRALQAPLLEMGLDWSIGLRTGDTASSERAAQSRRLPTALVTTPESLSLLLARADAQEALSTVRMIVIDEWHELLGNKRGVQVQLALARLRRWNPELIVWGLSATLGNLEHAMEVLVPEGKRRLVQGQLPKELVIDTLLPDTIERFPWAGHLGLRMLPKVVAEIETSSTALIFTNTRSQSELWYQAILEARPDWAGVIALHHGSLDKSVRDWVEMGLKEGHLKAVVCTSSLDLGVDFLPVERVLQIGSPKGIARLLQRAGRSGHAPGRPSRISLVPTHSLELVEAAAVRTAIERKQIEARPSPNKPLDVLVQHLVTIALGGGFKSEELRDEVRQSWAYRELTQQEWDWALAFVQYGGTSLAVYPDYRRVQQDWDGIWRVPDVRLARRHRMSIGTIVSDASMVVKYWSSGASGASLGTVEESFIARLSPGDAFLFGGRLLELVRVQDMVAYVKRATAKKAAVPRWNGGKMPLSTELADAVVAQMEEASNGRFDSLEMQLAKPLLDVQCQWSALPTSTTLLAEVHKSREGWHLFLYPFAGRHAHLGLANLLAYRVGRTQPVTFSIAVNDYGLELLSAVEVDWDYWLNAPELFSTEQLVEDVWASLNAGELAQRRFREIARISGLIFQGYPGAPKSTKQLQASSSLFYDVFRKYDPGNLLLTQAQQEVLRQELDIDRLFDTLQRLQRRTLNLKRPPKPAPFAFPLLVERFREQLSSEKLADRIRRMLQDLESAAGPGGYAVNETETEDAARFSTAEPPKIKRIRTDKPRRRLRI